MKEDSRWRIASRKAIAQCLEEKKPTTARDFKREVSAYYPFGERAYHPYKMWLSEVKKEAQRIEVLPVPDTLREYWMNPPLKKG